MSTGILFRLVFLLVFAGIGYLLSGRLQPPQRPAGWVAWLAGVVLAGYIGVNLRLISVLGLSLYLNDLLQGLGFGLLAGLLARRPRPPQ